MISDVVIVAAVRTPVGSFNGGLSAISASDLGAHVIRSLLEKSDIKAQLVDEIIMGQVLTAGCGQNPARQAAIGAGLPVSTLAYTINKVCGSGIKSVHLAMQSIVCGDSEIVIAGGQESMSQAPYLLSGARSGLKAGHAALTDSVIQDGLWDAFNDYHMGVTAENIAEKYAISREEQDRYALKSQSKAVNAQQMGYFVQEIVPLSVPQKKGPSIQFERDESPRSDATFDKLAKLKPVFSEHGTVTAGNASSLNDGAAAVLMMSAQRAQALKIPVMVRIVAFASAGVDPAYMGIAPVPATQLCLEKAGWTLEEVDLIEANEAFAAQAIALEKELGWDELKVNVNGGAIAIGHPIGASGCRILVSLIHELIRRDASKGIATLCIGGGQGVAIAVERTKSVRSHNQC